MHVEQVRLDARQAVRHGDQFLAERRQLLQFFVQAKILERFDRLIKKHGLLHLLKKGLSVDDARFDLMYPAPLASSAARVQENFATNLWSITRQVRYSQTNGLLALDVNGNGVADFAILISGGPVLLQTDVLL